MNRKYEFTGETRNWVGRTLHRIRAVRDFGDVKAGDLGGWIETESNLSNDGNAWVYGNAMVYGNADVSGNAEVSVNARVYGNAWVYGNAMVYGNADVSGNAEVSVNARVYGNAEVSGNAWVYGDARVYGNAWVSGNAWVYGDARVYGRKHILWISMIGSRDDTVTFMRAKDEKIIVAAGCFGGTIDEFSEKVKEKHGDNEHGKAYRLAIELAKLRIDLDKEETK